MTLRVRGGIDIDLEHADARIGGMGGQPVGLDEGLGVGVAGIGRDGR